MLCSEEAVRWKWLWMLLVSLYSCVIALEDGMSVPDVISVEWLAKHKDSVFVLDASYDMSSKPDPVEFRKKLYGNFEKLIAEKANSIYLSEHIPGAVHFNFDAAFFPSEFIRFDLYPPEEFERYVRMLGINADDHIVVYGRGRAAGMMWAARVWWTFKVYGHQKISVLEGGIDAWKKAGHSVTKDIVTLKPGTWSAKPLDPSLLITFEELHNKGADGTSLFDDLTKINYLDARPAKQFAGVDPLDTPAKGATGAHLKGAKNVPLSAVVSETGLKTEEEIKLALKKAGFDDKLPTVTACTTGIQASMLALALSRVGVRPRLYNGSMAEIGLRAPGLISEKS